MNPNSLFAVALGLHAPWAVADVAFDPAAGRIDFQVGFVPGSRFVCPHCGESRSDLNPQENLVRCFHCQTNFNPIDFTMAARSCDFVEAVHYLLNLTDRHHTR